MASNRRSDATSTVDSPALAKFIVACMEPIAEAELIDFGYNQAQRNTRLRPWCAAMCKVRVYDYALQTEAFKEYAPDLRLPSRDALQVSYRKALAAALLTPASNLADVAWKRRQKLDHVPVSAADVEALCLDDERFFAAHPVRRSAIGRREA